jgi:hypothetical protein
LDALFPSFEIIGPRLPSQIAKADFGVLGTVEVMFI